MVAKFIAPEYSGTAVQTHTIYTVTTSKVFRGFLGFQAQGHASLNTTIEIKVGNQRKYKATLAAGRWIYTAAPMVFLPGLGITPFSGIIRCNDPFRIYDGQAAGETPEWIHAPWALKLTVEATQTIIAIITGNAAQSGEFKLEGVLDDAP